MQFESLENADTTLQLSSKMSSSILFSQMVSIVMNVTIRFLPTQAIS